MAGGLTTVLAKLDALISAISKEAVFGINMVITRDVIDRGVRNHRLYRWRAETLNGIFQLGGGHAQGYQREL